MAMFHFRLKSDKKTSGTKISSIKHVEYINREGTFAHDEQWKKSNKFVGYSITMAETPNALGEFNALLYKTDELGAIKNAEHGLEVTENASLTTTSIALMLADEAMEHKPLIINVSVAFRKSVLEAAFQANLPISFQNKLLQRALESKKENQENEREKFLATGGRIISKRPDTKSRTSPTYAKRVEDATKDGFRLPTLSQLTLVHSESKGTDVLLQAEEFNGMDEYARE